MMFVVLDVGASVDVDIDVALLMLWLLFFYRFWLCCWCYRWCFGCCCCCRCWFYCCYCFCFGVSIVFVAATSVDVDFGGDCGRTITFQSCFEHVLTNSRVYGVYITHQAPTEKQWGFEQWPVYMYGAVISRLYCVVYLWMKQLKCELLKYWKISKLLQSSHWDHWGLLQTMAPLIWTKLLDKIKVRILSKALNDGSIFGAEQSTDGLFVWTPDFDFLILYT